MLVTGDKHFCYVICKYVCNTLSGKIWDLLFLATIFHISSLLERGKRGFSHDYSISKKVTFVYIYIYIYIPNLYHRRPTSLQDTVLSDANITPFTVTLFKK